MQHVPWKLYLLSQSLKLNTNKEPTTINFENKFFDSVQFGEVRYSAGVSEPYIILDNMNWYSGQTSLIYVAISNDLRRNLCFMPLFLYFLPDFRIVIKKKGVFYPIFTVPLNINN